MNVLLEFHRNNFKDGIFPSVCEIKHMRDLFRRHYGSTIDLGCCILITNIFELKPIPNSSLRGRSRDDCALFLMYILSEDSRSVIQSLTQADMDNISERKPIFSNPLGPIRLNNEGNLLYKDSLLRHG